MPISYRIDETRRRIYTRAEGVVTYAELRAHMNAEAGATTDVTPEDVRRLAWERQEVARRQPPGPVAVVATDDLFFGMLRMYDMLTERVRPLRVFRHRQEAEQWLDDISRPVDAA
jgi:hypothetical protein